MSTAAPDITPVQPAPRADGRKIATVFGAGLAVAGSVVALAAGGLLALTGSDGRLDSGTQHVGTPTSALVTDAAKIEDTAEVSDVVGAPTVHVSADARSGSGGVFVGVARRADVDRYLAGATIDRVRDFDVDPFRLSTSRRAGTADPKAPGTQSFWVARSSGRNTAKLDWKVTDGNYRMVVMNADGSRGVDTDSSFALTLPHLPAIAISTLAFGLLLVGGGIFLVVRNTGTRKA